MVYYTINGQDAIPVLQTTPERPLDDPKRPPRAGRQPGMIDTEATQGSEDVLTQDMMDTSYYPCDLTCIKLDLS
jgi:hypothetical protein